MIKNFFKKIFGKKEENAKNEIEEVIKDDTEKNGGFKEYIKRTEDEETNVLELQRRYRRGEIADNDLTQEQINSLCMLYDRQIEDLKRNNLFSIVCGEDVHISNSRFQENIICIKKDLLSDGLDYDFVLNKLKPILEDENIKKILFDVKNSKYFFAQYSISLKGEIFDVKLADYLTKCGRRHVKSLEELCEQENYKINSVSGMLFNCFNLYTKKLNDFDMQFLYNSIEFPLINVLYGMEVDGFKLDFNILKKMNEDYNKELKQLNDEIIVLAGEKFNLNSPKQLGNILFEKLGLPNLQKGSTNIEVLENLQNVHPIIDLIIRYRKIYKLNSTYVDAYLEKMDKSNHIVHTYFNQMLTQTGRLSSTEPNLQNIPIREDKGRNLRKIFISRFDNGQIISADYSQIELRLLAHFSCDEKLVDAFNKNLDIHASTASEIFNVPLNLVTSEMRRKAKAVNFGIVYGISDYGLSQSLHCSRKEAKEFIDKYFETYPNVKKYLESSIVFAKENGFVKTMFNRRRFIDELNSNNYNLKQFGERVALNMPLQGTASDIIKLAMIEVEKEFENKNLKSKLILQIHDELICDTYPGEEDKVSNILLEKMQNVVKLNIPLVVNLSIGKSLYEAKD